MVMQASALGRSGLHDWFLQRLSALVLAAYVVVLFGWAFTHNVDYMSWRELFACTAFKVISLVALTGVTVHAWIGMWTVMTDYIKPMAVRFVLQSLIILTCLAVLLWGATILWSV